MSTDIVVGLLSLLGVLYLAWLQQDMKKAEAKVEDAEAVHHLTEALLQAVETLAGREQVIVELRARIEALEREDRLKTARISELERKITHLEAERTALLEERERLLKGAEVAN